MTELFMKLLNMSINAGWLVLTVLLVRIIFRKAPNGCSPYCGALFGSGFSCQTHWKVA